jgi:hypothetical protein
MARVRVQQGCCARAHRDVLTASLETLAQWPRSAVELIQTHNGAKTGSNSSQDLTMISSINTCGLKLKGNTEANKRTLS